MTNPIQVSAKTLGQLALPNFCPRCFWIRLHNPQLPYQIFPGIFSSIDGYSKRYTAVHFEGHLRLPNWFYGIGLDACPLPVPHWSKFQFVDDETRVKLTGVPDEILKLPGRSGSLAIVDYKTARYTHAQDELLPMYATQLNCYSLIAERIGLGRTKSLWLYYFEPRTDIGYAQLHYLTNDDSLALWFDVTPVPVKLDPTKVPSLLQRARELYELSAPPTGRDGCKDCRLLDNLLKTLTMSEAA